MKPNFKSFLRPVLLSAVAVASVSSLHAANLIWDPDATTTGVQEGNGTWTATSINFWNGNGNASPVKGTDSIQFGVATTGTNTVGINGGGSLLNYSDSTSSSALTINHGYIFNGVTGLDGLSIGNITVNNGSAVTFNTRVIGGIPTGSPLAATGRKTWVLNNGSTLTFSAGGTLQNIGINGAAPTVVNLTGGTFTAGGTLATSGTPDGSVQLGGGGNAATPAILTINHGAGATVSSTVGGNYNIGGNASSNAGSLTTYNLDGGTIGGTNGNSISLGGGAAASAGGAASMAIFNLNSGSYSTNGQIRVANDGGSGTLNVKAGTFTTGSNVIIARRSNTGGPIAGTINISGGVVKATQIQFGDGQTFATGTPSSANLNLSGGALYLNNAIGFLVSTTPNVNLSPVINLSGGTLGASTNWSTTMPITLSGAGTTFKTGNDASPSASFSITLSGNLTGSGPLRVGGGGGQLSIAGPASSYSGGTFLSSGSLLTPTASPTTGFNSLGTGDVTVTGEATLLNLQNASSISDWGILTINQDSWLGLSFTGIEIVAGAVIKTPGGSITLPPGDYSAEQFLNNGVLCLGEGIIRVVPAGYSAWATTNAGGQAANLDFDKDGVPNGIEYFFGATGSSFTANPSVVNGKITWPMSSAATGATYKVQTSTTLASGGWSDVPQGSLVVTAGTPVGSVAYTLPTGGPKLFVRLVVTIP